MRERFRFSLSFAIEDEWCRMILASFSLLARRMMLKSRSVTANYSNPLKLTQIHRNPLKLTQTNSNLFNLPKSFQTYLNYFKIHSSLSNLILTCSSSHLHLNSYYPSSKPIKPLTLSLLLNILQTRSLIIPLAIHSSYNP